MGSRSRSSTTQSSVTNNETTEINTSLGDYSVGDGTRATTTTNGDGNVITINTSDFGAIEGGIGLGKDALKFADSALGGALDFGKSALDKVDNSADRTTKAITGLASAQERSNADTIDKVLAITTARTTDGSAQLMRMLMGLGITAAAVFLLYTMMKNKKG